MAAVNPPPLFNQPHSDKYISHHMNPSVGTDETGVAKVDISGLVKPDGTAPTAVSIERVQFSVSPTMLVQILFDHDTDDLALVLSGTGDFTFDVPIIDPQSTGGTGDILFTTLGGSATESYDVMLYLRLY